MTISDQIPHRILYLKNVASNPHLVTSSNANTWANLELPLRTNHNLHSQKRLILLRIQKMRIYNSNSIHLAGHDLAVDATNVDAGK